MPGAVGNVERIVAILVAEKRVGAVVDEAQGCDEIAPRRCDVERRDAVESDTIPALREYRPASETSSRVDARP